MIIKIPTRVCLFSLVFVCAQAHSGQFTDAKNKACPDAWALTDKTVPIVYSTTNPWSQSANAANDKALAKSHIAESKPLVTLPTLPVTDDDLVNDPLTVASECLVYRNFEVDTWSYVEPPAQTPNLLTGWIPAAVF
jgi:hypothetical protein